MQQTYEKATFWNRLSAYVIDVTLIIAVMTIYFLIGLAVVLTQINVNNFTVMDLLTALVIFLPIALISIITYLYYFIALEVKYSQTLGKKIMGLKVMNINGQKITWKQGFLRNLPKLSTEFLIGDMLIGKLLLNKPNLRAFDTLAETIVVKT